MSTLPDRHARVLDLSSFPTQGACLSALMSALDECRREQARAETDPAVQLLTRHLADLARRDLDDNEAALRRRCIERAGAKAKTPALARFIGRDVGYDEDAKEAFLAAARAALGQLAGALGLAKGSYDLRLCRGGPAVSGEAVLHGEQLYVTVSNSSLGFGEILFRRCEGRKDYRGGMNHWARLTELLHPHVLAGRMAHEIGPQAPAVSSAPATLLDLVA